MGYVFAEASAEFTGRAITLSLSCGLLVLTIWLLVLVRTRWGHARPIAKCAALSLFVHLLLGIYAYGTRIFVDYPAMHGSQTTRVVLTMADDGATQAETQTTDAAEQPSEWLHPFEETMHEPPAAELARAEAEPMREQAAPSDPASSSLDEVSAELPLPAPDEQHEPADDEQPMPEAPAAEPAVAEAAPLPTEANPQQVAQATVEPVETMPPMAELERQTVTDDSNDPLATSEPPSDIDEPNEGDAELQTLNEQLFTDDQSVARAGEQDQSQSSASSEPASSATGDEEDVFAPSIMSQVALQTTPAPTALKRRPGDGAELPRQYQARSAGQREAQLQAMGGDAQTEEAVERALAWLAANQSEDGRWQAAAFGAGQEQAVLGHNRGGAGARADTGITGLALLSFFGAGHTHFEGPYRKNVQHGLEFLLRSQAADGSLRGDAELFAAMYCHGIAFLALSEGYAMTGDERLKPFVQKAQQFTLHAQIPYDGGWRYRPGDHQGDMSQFGWQVMALRSAEVAGISIPRESREGMVRFLNSACSGRHQGLASYRANAGPSRTMTAEAITCRYFLQMNPGEEMRREAADYLMQEKPGGEPANFYYWYYGSLAMQQMHDPRWDQWNEALKHSLLTRQCQDGELAGSWEPNTVWGGYGGRVYTTAMACMCLEVYYRYLPVYRMHVAEEPIRPVRR